MLRFGLSMNYFLRLVLLVIGIIGLVLTLPETAAQSNADDITPIGVSSQLIEAGKESLSNRPNLSEEKKNAALAFYDTAASSLMNGNKSLEEAKRLRLVLENAASRQEAHRGFCRRRN